MPRSHELALVPPEIRLQKLMFENDEDGAWPPPRTARELAALLRARFGFRMGPAEVESILESSPAYEVVPGAGLRRWCAAGKAPPPAPLASASASASAPASPSALALPAPARCPLGALARGEVAGGVAVLSACGVEVWGALEAAGPPARLIFLADTPGGLAAERDYLARAATGLGPWASVAALAVSWGAADGDGIGDEADGSPRRRRLSPGALGGLAAKVVSECGSGGPTPVLVLPAEPSADETTFAAFAAAGGVRATVAL